MVTAAAAGLLLITMGSGSGCAAARTPVEPDQPFQTVRTVIDERTSLAVEWPRDEEARAQIREEVERILAEEPFTPDVAVQVALLNNPRLRAEFEEIGIAHATVVQAGMISNPRMSFTAKFPDASPHRPRLEIPFIQNVVDLYLIPMRRRVAGDLLKQAMLRTSEAVLSLGDRVRVAYYSLAAADRLLEIEQQALQAASDDVNRARALAEQGRVDDLELRRALAAQQAQRLRIALAQIEVENRRNALRELLGITATELHWPQDPVLPELPEAEPDLAILEIKGLQHRFDIELARQEVELVYHATRLTRRTLFPLVNLGITIERDRDRTLLIGPKLSLELPVFDQKQGEIGRLQAQMRQSRDLYEAQIDRALTEIRTARAQYVGARRTAEFYREIVVPLRGQVSDAVLRQHMARALGVDELLVARDEELLSRLASVAALRDYWIARSRLERVTACNLDGMPPDDKPLAWLRWAPAELRPSAVSVTADSEPDRAVAHEWLSRAEDLGDDYDDLEPEAEGR